MSPARKTPATSTEAAKPTPPAPKAEPTFQHTLETGADALLSAIAHHISVEKDDIVSAEVKFDRGFALVITRDRAARGLKFAERTDA